MRVPSPACSLAELAVLSSANAPLCLATSASCRTPPRSATRPSWPVARGCSSKTSAPGYPWASASHELFVRSAAMYKRILEDTWRNDQRRPAAEPLRTKRPCDAPLEAGNPRLAGCAAAGGGAPDPPLLCVFCSWSGSQETMQRMLVPARARRHDHHIRFNTLGAGSGGPEDGAMPAPRRLPAGSDRARSPTPPRQS